MSGYLTYIIYSVTTFGLSTLWIFFFSIITSEHLEQDKTIRLGPLHNGIGGIYAYKL